MKGQIAMRNAREDTGRKIMTFKGGMIMKKVLSIIASIIAAALIIVMLPGCELGEGNIPPSLTQEAYEAEATITKLKTEVEDKAFWDSAERAAELIEKTIERRTNISIDIRLRSDESEIVLQNHEIELKYINDAWRSIASNRMLYAVATSEEVAKAHEAGKAVEVTGIILRWRHTEQRLFSANINKIISVCDIDDDGAWDYTAEGKMFFTQSDIVSLEGEHGEKLGIGLDTITNASITPVKDAVTLAEFYSITQN